MKQAGIDVTPTGHGGDPAQAILGVARSGRCWLWWRRGRGGELVPEKGT
jgi:hypothetical protein